MNLYGISVQTSAPKCGCKIPDVSTIQSLLWLPVRFSFKVLPSPFKSLNHLAPPYLVELLHPYHHGTSCS